jgi:hypothetical protein
MAIEAVWAFLCETVDVGPNGEIVSMRNIIRPHSGFVVRRLPATLRPSFTVALRGTPGETVTIIVAIENDGQVVSTPPRSTVIPPGGLAEIVVPCGTLTVESEGDFTFILAVNGIPVLTIKAGIDRAL